MARSTMILALSLNMLLGCGDDATVSASTTGGPNSPDATASTDSSTGLSDTGSSDSSSVDGKASNDANAKDASTIDTGTATDASTTSDASTARDAANDSATTGDGGRPTLPCGPGLTCDPWAGESCCVSPSGTVPYSCIANGQNCIGSGYHCLGKSDCADGNVCCLNSSPNGNSSSCTQPIKCGETERNLCRTVADCPSGASACIPQNPPLLGVCH